MGILAMAKEPKIKSLIQTCQYLCVNESQSIANTNCYCDKFSLEVCVNCSKNVTSPGN